MNADNWSPEERVAFMSTCAFCNKPLNGESGSMITVREANGRTGVALAHGECVLSRLHPAMREKFEQFAE